jgi:adenylylsulfate kinase
MPSDVRAESRALLITGTVGSGKTSVANAAGSLLAEARIPHAVIDLDALSESWPAPPDDPFNSAMELQNLQCVAGNYLRAGAQRLVLSGVVETRAARERYRERVGVDLYVCRLRADLPELHRRLRIRHAGDDAGMKWHLNRAGQLDRILDDSRVEDFEVLSDGQMITDVAATVLNRTGWLRD